MLDDNAEHDTVHWGERGDTFIVVAVRAIEFLTVYSCMLTVAVGRTIQQSHPAEAFQSLQYVEFHTATAQV